MGKTLKLPFCPVCADGKTELHSPPATTLECENGHRFRYKEKGVSITLMPVTDYGDWLEGEERTLELRLDCP